MHELNWGLAVVSYLFLAGLGAGALTVSASVLLRGGPTSTHFDIARYGALIAPIPVALGCGLLVFELGSFQAGHWFRWINLYKVINLSPMSVGTWFLTFFIGVSALYGYTFLSRNAAPGDKYHSLRRKIAWLGVPLGIGVAVYTGVLLGAMPARPFWNSPILAMLFLMYAHLTIGNVKAAVSIILAGGAMASLFWFWVVLLGLVIPALIELYLIVPRLIYHREFAVHRSFEIVVPAAVLVGGFMLRYVVVIAGQITHPVGL